MKYRVLRYFEGEDSQYMLIGHFDLKMQAKAAISEDQSNHSTTPGLVYRIDEVEKELTQADIDRIFNELKPAEDKGR